MLIYSFGDQFPKFLSWSATILSSLSCIPVGMSNVSDDNSGVAV